MGATSRMLRLASLAGVFLFSACAYRIPPPGPTAPCQPTSLPPPATPIPTSYKFDVGDQVELSVWHEDDLRTTQYVLPDGTITPPLLDPVRIAGDTIPQVRQKLATLYGEYVKEPVVSVRVSEINSLRVFVLGEVSDPGAVSIRAPTTILQVIAQVGGFNELTADKCTVRIIRMTENCKTPQVYSVPARDIIAGVGTDVRVAPGDVIYVHPSKLANWSRELALAFAPFGAIIGTWSSGYYAVNAIQNMGN